MLRGYTHFSTDPQSTLINSEYYAIIKWVVIVHYILSQIRVVISEPVILYDMY